MLSPKGDIRSVGFVQRVDGMRVVGGAIGFAFKADRLALVTSTALPHVSVTRPASRLASSAIGNAVERWLRADGYPQVDVGTTTELVVVPIVRPRIGAPEITYRIAEQVSAKARTTVGAWNVWIDAQSARPIQRQSTIHYQTGKLMFNVPDRQPSGARSAKPAAFAKLVVDGAAATTTADGTVTWTGAGSASVKPKGTLVDVSVATGTAASTTLSLVDGGNATWSLTTPDTNDAQLTSYVYANQAKAFAKAKLNPTLAWNDQTLSVTVNENMTCNAYSTGDDIHFFISDFLCENTGRIADVVYHEYGHSLHNNSIISGVGAFDGGLSEGLGDMFSMLITHDPKLGKGFFKFAPGNALRDLNPSGSEKKWGVDNTGEVHQDGEIIAGTLWDLYAMFEASLGATAGFEKTADIYYTIMQRASDIPSTFPEALLGDDDDGDLTNGTPNKCAIETVFAAHNLAVGAPPGIEKPVREGFKISVKATVPVGNAACPYPTLTSAEIKWRLRGGTDATVAMTKVGDKFEGSIPTQADGSVVQYQVTLTLSDGQKLAYPSNKADPFYEMYVGPVAPIWCASFESGATGWTTSNDWEAGTVAGLAGDPKTAFAGTGVFGTDLTMDGAYDISAQSFAESPEIDLQGKAGIRLQLQRWLVVEDGFYDKARILVNGTEIWKNRAAADMQSPTINHVDREWRFADFDLATQAASGKVKIRFELAADQGLQLGGWTLDDVCIVTTAEGPSACGNGTVDSGEQCDDGNIVSNDGCSPTCTSESNPSCGNGTVDSGEECDDGNTAAGDGCSAACQDEAGGGGDDGGGCCSAGGRGIEGAVGLSLLTLGFVLRRRRRGA